MTIAENNSFFQNTNTNNIILGRYALVSVTNGLNNFAGGANALVGLTTGNENIGIGISALTTVTSGSYNIGIGSQSQLKNSQGIGNVNSLDLGLIASDFWYNIRCFCESKLSCVVELGDVG